MASRRRVINQKIAVFPGSFDPVHLGHLDLIERAARLFDRLVVAVSRKSTEEKRALFSVEERVALLRAVLSGTQNVEVDSYSGLTVHYAERKGACAIIRGVRSGSDAQFEAGLFGMNSALCPAVETVVLLARPRLSHISSTLVREIAFLGGNASSFVPDAVAAAIRRKLG